MQPMNTTLVYYALEVLIFTRRNLLVFLNVNDEERDNVPATMKKLKEVCEIGKPGSWRISMERNLELIDNFVIENP
jgi:hypothetical protein